MLLNVIIFIVALWAVGQSAMLATKHAALLAESYRLSKYTVGFLIVAILSILPEMFISINSAISGMPEFGLGMLFGANVADLTLIFAILVLVSGRKLKIESKILNNHASYPFLLLLPIAMGLNGHFSRLEGLILILIGAAFYYVALKNDADGTLPIERTKIRYKSFFVLIISIIALLIGAHFIVESAVKIAQGLNISPILIGMLVVGLGTTVPELFFSLKAVKKKDDSLAIGDLLGTVLADATIVVGILALINPFTFPIQIIYITGMFMVVASFLLFYFMRTGKRITKIEAIILFIFWLVFIAVEFFTGTSILN